MNRRIVIGWLVILSLGFVAFVYDRSLPTRADKRSVYKPRVEIDSSGFYDSWVFNEQGWPPDASLEEVAAAHQRHITRRLEELDHMRGPGPLPREMAVVRKAAMLNSLGKPEEAYRLLDEFEAAVMGTYYLEEEMLYTLIYYKGLTGLRMGENDNCILCRGESACIFPIAPAAMHTNPKGSRLAIKHFSAYLEQFPDDLEVKWLLNLAHRTLGEYPAKVEPRHLLRLDSWEKPSPFDVGVFRDISHRVGLQRLNQSGGAIMDDFDNDGLLDLVVTDWSPDAPMAFYRNKGDGTFEDRTKAAGLGKQLGGLYCVQTDYNNDGYLDIFVARGAWLSPSQPIRPSLLRNNGNGTFTDVTHEAGLQASLNSNSVSWADYDNDGFLDMFACGHHRPCPLYRNKGDGTFEEVSAKAGLPTDLNAALGATWFDYDNDGYPDLFVNMGKGIYGPPRGTARLYHNNRNGTFTDVTKEMGIDGPINGFSCWAFDYDNDGWLDIFASTVDQSIEDVIKGIMGQPHSRTTAKLYRNLQGKGFRDVTKEAGLDMVFAPMGSNFADIDNDGYLDFYLATGNPQLSTLIPNRLFRNVAGKRFVEITASSRTGHLQKGHAVAFGDWRRCGSLDLFVQMGGAVPGDHYHNALFQNPGQGNNWLSVKLVGKKTNRAAMGARIKVVTTGPAPLTVHRHVSSGSSFGANSLEQHIGLGKAGGVARLEVYWPVSGTTQVFEDIAANQGIVITELATSYEKRSWKTIPLPD
jgi:hypothetical protein